MTDVLLVLIAPPELEEPLIDWLLERDAISGFTGLPAYGHSRNHGRYSLLEQVSGRQRRAIFQVQAETDEAQSLLGALRTEFSGTGLHYWVLPLIEAGHLD
jgi:hypothetical protein